MTRDGDRGRAGSTWLAFVLALWIGGCTQHDNLSDLKAYVAGLEKMNPGHVEPLPEIKPYESFTYVAGELRDPFTPPAQPQAEEKKLAAGAGIHPDVNRPRESLEAFPLDSLRMVGTLQRDGTPWALIKVPDGTIYRVHPGNYLGQNYGKIVSIREAQIDLKEIVPDPKGGWQERQAKIELTE
jgi:type IV pilus assembly protein PilP